jgi:hypothetical protein
MENELHLAMEQIKPVSGSRSAEVETMMRLLGL